MALKKQVTTRQGYQAEYWKVTRIEIDKNSRDASCVLSLYKDKSMSHIKDGNIGEQSRMVALRHYTEDPEVDYTLHPELKAMQVMYADENYVESVKPPEETEEAITPIEDVIGTEETINTSEEPTITEEEIETVETIIEDTEEVTNTEETDETIVDETVPTTETTETIEVAEPIETTEETVETTIRETVEEITEETVNTVTEETVVMPEQVNTQEPELTIPIPEEVVPTEEVIEPEVEEIPTEETNIIYTDRFERYFGENNIYADIYEACYAMTKELEPFFADAEDC